MIEIGADLRVTFMPAAKRAWANIGATFSLVREEVRAERESEDAGLESENAPPWSAAPQSLFPVGKG